MLYDFQKDVDNFKNKLGTKIDIADFARMEQSLTKFATLDKVKQLDNRFAHYVKNDYFYELK